MQFITVDFETMPADEDAQVGYVEILSIWRRIKQGFDENPRSFNQELLSCLAELRPLLTQRELAFLDEPFDAATTSSAAVEAKTVAKVYKILMDRHGFKVSREGGGLGV
jgi:hypothetical protein